MDYTQRMKCLAKGHNSQDRQIWTWSILYENLQSYLLGYDSSGINTVLDWVFIHSRNLCSPIPVDVRCTESEAVVDEGGVNLGVLGPVQQVIEVAQVSVASPHPVPGTVLI